MHFCRHCEGVSNRARLRHTPAQHKERASRADLKGGATMSDRSSSARGAGSHEPIARIA